MKKKTQEAKHVPEASSQPEAGGRSLKMKKKCKKLTVKTPFSIPEISFLLENTVSRGYRFVDRNVRKIVIRVHIYMKHTEVIEVGDPML